MGTVDDALSNKSLLEAAINQCMDSIEAHVTRLDKLNSINDDGLILDSDLLEAQCQRVRYKMASDNLCMEILSSVKKQHNPTFGISHQPLNIPRQPLTKG